MPRNLGIVMKINSRSMDGLMKEESVVLWNSGKTFWTRDFKYGSMSETVGQRGAVSSRSHGIIDPRKT